MQQAGEETPAFSVAAVIPATRRFTSRRRRRVLFVLVGAAAVVFAINSPLFSWVDGGALLTLLRVLVAVAGVVLVAAIAIYVRVVWIERVLRVNPWVTWGCRAGAVRLGGLTVTHVVELTHSQWPGPVYRTVFSRRAGEMLKVTGASAYAAGDPKRSMMVSPDGGEHPMYARRPLVPGALSLLRRKAGF